MVWHLFPGKFGDDSTFLLGLRKLADVAQEVMVLEEPPACEVDRDMEGTGNKQSEASGVSPSSFGGGFGSCGGMELLQK